MGLREIFMPEKCFREFEKWEDELVSPIVDPRERCWMKFRVSAAVREGACGWTGIPLASIYKHWTRRHFGIEET